MKFSKLLETEKDALANPNYQHKDMKQSDRMELAKKSFKRLSTKEAEDVYISWKKFIHKPFFIFINKMSPFPS